MKLGGMIKEAQENKRRRDNWLRTTSAAKIHPLKNLLPVQLLQKTYHPYLISRELTITPR